MSMEAIIGPFFWLAENRKMLPTIFPAVKKISQIIYVFLVFLKIVR